MFQVSWLVSIFFLNPAILIVFFSFLKRKRMQKSKDSFWWKEFAINMFEKKNWNSFNFYCSFDIFKHLIQINFQIKFEILRYFYW